ncbi:ImmA/IrrE family metallo-endopeptidase, partial [bacterium]|nr:ImmA/IrrE family metallo-endopeptidase [bacterium]
TPGGTWDAVRQGDEVADEFRRTVGISDLRPPHDLEEILTSLEVVLVPMKLPAGVSGAAIGDAEHGNVIVFDKTESRRRQRFTVAHELGHLVMDPLPLIDAGQNHPAVETRANAFAASILMPANWIHLVARGLGVSQTGESKVAALGLSDGDLSITKARRIAKGRGPCGALLSQVVVEAAVSFQAATYRLQRLDYLAAEEGEDLRTKVGPSPEEPRLTSNLANLVWWKTFAALEGERITPRRAKEILAPLAKEMGIDPAHLDDVLGLPVV